MFKQQDDFDQIIAKYQLWDDMNICPVDKEELFNAMLDETSEVPKGSIYAQYPAHKILLEVDPVAYRCGLSEYEDVLAEDYFRGPDEEFYEPDKVKDAITEALQERLDALKEKHEEEEDAIVNDMPC